jgi:GntR family transcriptional repressor for pyruvate dehydrogenase complex
MVGVTNAARSANDDLSFMSGTANQPLRLYQKIAKIVIDELRSGQYAVGDRMPAERDLAKKFGVSRPVVREAMLALEVLGLIEVRIGSGAYVMRLSTMQDEAGFNVSAFELIESRMLFESEAAALAATQITDEEIEELESLVQAIRDENRRSDGTEQADRAFHVSIARATRNAAIEHVVDELWQLRSSSPECALMLEKARRANVRPVVEEHTAIVEALKARDAKAARAAMRAHLAAVINHLLFAIEEQAVVEARNSVAATRERLSQSAKR